jgi:capsular exopolysaccharide synthesis family protein
MLMALRRRWVLAVALGLVIATAAGAATYMLVPGAKFTATATLYVASKTTRIAFATDEDRTDARTFQRTQAAFLTDPIVLSHALSKPRVAKCPTIRVDLAKRLLDPEQWLKSQLVVRFSSGSELLEVSLSGDRPDDLATIVNEVVDSYKSQIVDAERNARIERLSTLEKLWHGYLGDLKDRRKELKDLVENVGSHNELALATAQQLKMSQLNVFQDEAMRAQTDLRKLEATLGLAESRPAGPEPEDAGQAVAGLRDRLAAPTLTAGEREVDLHPDVITLKGRVDAAAMKYRQMLARTRLKNDPSVKTVLAQWQLAKQALDDRKESIRVELQRGRGVPGPGGDISGPMTPAERRAAEVARLKADAEVLRSYHAALEKDISRLKKEIKDLSEGGIDVEDKRAEIDISSDFARKVGAEREYLRVEIAAPARVRVLSEAKPPRNRDELRQAKFAGLAAAATLLVTVFGVSYWEFLGRRVGGPEQVSLGLGLRLVGVVPALPTQGRGRWRGGALEKIRKSALVESIDSMRTLLLHASSTEQVSVVLITSAVKGEAKTSLSCHLASSFARSGRRTLLIDGDLRSPTVHRMFDEEVGPGFCDYLRGEVLPGQIVRMSIMENLDYVPAGKFDAVAQSSLARVGLSPLLAELRPSYDFIIVDSAPVLPVADSLQLSQGVDCVLLSVLHQVSRLPAVYSAVGRLSGVGARIFGAVVSGMPVKADHAYYSYYSTTPT